MLAEMTLKEFATKGGHARAKALSQQRRSEIAKQGMLAAKRAGKLLGRPRSLKTGAKMVKY